MSITVYHTKCKAVFNHSEVTVDISAVTPISDIQFNLLKSLMQSSFVANMNFV